MDTTPLISVIIPTFNRKDKILKSLNSVLSQSYKNIEVIVVDDASTDGTYELFETLSDDRVRFLRYEENKGAPYARNFGAANSKGEYIAFHDSDDTWHEDKLEKEFALLTESKADMCFCGMNRVADNGNSFYYPVHPLLDGDTLGQFLSENRASTQTMLMHRYVWESLKFDESFRRYQDWDFAIRIAQNYKMAYLPVALVESQVGGDSISFAVNSYPALVHLYEKHKSLYEKYPESDAVMNRRMGKRLQKADPASSAAHYKKSFALSHKWYDLGYYLLEKFRSHRAK